MSYFQVRTKTFVAVGHESANNVVKDHMQANLLANMELGGNLRAESPRTTGESIQMTQQHNKSDDPSYQMRGTNESDDAYYSRGPLQVCCHAAAATSMIRLRHFGHTVAQPGLVNGL